MMMSALAQKLANRFLGIERRLAGFVGDQLNRSN
jgi:hypothetical protein